MDNVILGMRHITKTFPGVKALDDVNLTVHAGEVHAICGENGAGKSTLMKVLSGVYPHGTYDGEITFDGRPVAFSDIKSSESTGIVIIHQELALIPELSIAENIFLGNENTHRGLIDWRKAESQAKVLMERVGLYEDPRTLVKTIGVGKQQLVEIAKALNKNVKLLILDEPTAALNENDSQHLLDLIRQLRSRGVTSIIISHKLNEIMALADTITVLRDGQTVETLIVDENLDEDRLIRSMVGRPLDSRFPDYTPNIGETFFEVKNWTVRHPDMAECMVSNDNSFFVRRGEIVGFAGLMGAGRTELARSLFGRSYGSYIRGTIIMDGKEVVLKNVSQAIKHGLAYVTEDRKALGFNHVDAIKATVSSADLARITENHLISDYKEHHAAEDYRRSLNIKAPTVESATEKLSGGNQQKVVLAKWLFTEPDLLILDEPTRGIDVGAKYEIYKIIQSLAARGKGVILISSELPELLGLADRIYTLNAGHITGCLDRAEADQESLMKLMTQDARRSTAAAKKSATTSQSQNGNL
ncbi:MAG: multiple monosaccharide ABC transporter ATP-binding protein [Propionibacteriaceae bacterium]